MATQDTGSGARIVKRIEELLQSSTLPPETVLSFLRSAQADPKVDPLKELERLQNKHNHAE